MASTFKLPERHAEAMERIADALEYFVGVHKAEHQTPQEPEVPAEPEQEVVVTSSPAQGPVSEGTGE